MDKMDLSWCKSIIESILWYPDVFTMGEVTHYILESVPIESKVGRASNSQVE